MSSASRKAVKAETASQREWLQTSTEAGLGGLTVDEAVLGIMQSPFLQMLPDPLHPKDTDDSWAKIGIEEGIIGMCQTLST